MSTRISNQSVDEYVTILDASQPDYIEFNSVVFAICSHPQLGDFIGVSTPLECFIVTNE